CYFHTLLLLLVLVLESLRARTMDDHENQDDFVRSFDFLDVIQLPSLVEISLGRTVEAEDWEPAFAGDGLNPVSLLFRLGRAEGDVDHAVGVGDWFGVTAYGGQGLTAL